MFTVLKARKPLHRQGVPDDRLRRL